MRRALVVEGPGRLALAERPALEPGPQEVVIRPALCGLCGTDIELRDGAVDPAFVRYPLTLGHEWSGIVEAVGSGVAGIAPGDRVVAECIIPCGTCAELPRGRDQRVRDLRRARLHARGRRERPGRRARRALVHVLAPAVSLLDAALVEPTSVVHARPREGDARAGRARARDRRRHDRPAGGTPRAPLVARRDRHARPPRRSRPRSPLAAGATSFTTDDAVATGFDFVIEAAGVTEAMALAVGAARRGGRVLLLGLPPTGRVLELPADLLVNNDLDARGELRLHLGRLEPRRAAAERRQHRARAAS